MSKLTGQSKCFHYRKAYFLHAYDYSISCSPVPVSIRRTHNKWLYIAFHYKTQTEEKLIWDIVNAFGVLEWYRDKMNVSDEQLLADTVEMSRAQLIKYLKAHRRERLETEGIESKSIIDFERANLILPRPTDRDDTERRLRNLDHENKEVKGEKAVAEKNAEEERKIKIRVNRELSKLCIMCGKPLGFLNKLFGTKKHTGCETFAE